MANNYCQSSSWMNIPKSKLKRAKKICDKIAAELEANANEGYCGVLYDIETEHPGIWFHGDESINVEHLETHCTCLGRKVEIETVLLFMGVYLQ